MELEDNIFFFFLGIRVTRDTEACPTGLENMVEAQAVITLQGKHGTTMTGPPGTQGITTRSVMVNQRFWVETKNVTRLKVA